MAQGHACPPSSPDVICLSLTQELTDGSRSSAILAKITHSGAEQLSGIQIDGSAWAASSSGVSEGEPTIPYTEQIRLDTVASAGCTVHALAPVTPFSITVAQDCPTNLFKEAKQLFDEQFPMIQFATAGKETTVDMPMLTNSTYTGSVSLTPSFGSTSAFAQVETSSG